MSLDASHQRTEGVGDFGHISLQPTDILLPPTKSRMSAGPIFNIYTFWTPAADSFHKIYTRPSNVRGLDAMRGSFDWRPIAALPSMDSSRVSNFYADLQEGCG
jgi:hypothetical protein